MPSVLTFVESPADVAGSVRSFSADWRVHQRRFRTLLVTTSYWVHDPATGEFGPSKFVGFREMSYSTYEQHFPESDEPGRFQGQRTHEAIKRALGGTFRRNRSLADRLREWGQERLGDGAFIGTDSAKWKFIKLPAAAPAATGDPRGALDLPLHKRSSRKNIFAQFGIEYSSKQQHLNTGLSPQNPDGGYCIFVTLDKSTLSDEAYDYADELYGDRVRWVTRRDRGANHPTYVDLRDSNTRVSLFVRTKSDDLFAYLGELAYSTHREFGNEPGARVQQEYVFKLEQPVSPALHAELTEGTATRGRARSTATAQRRPSNLDAYKKAFSYALGRLDRTVNSAHHDYQIRLRKFLDGRGITAEWERDYVDVRFWLDGRLFIAEIKVTTYLRLDEAFRTALGQLLVYGHTKVREPHSLVMFLDARPSSALLELAGRLEIAVVVEQDRNYTLANRKMDNVLRSLFRRS